MPRLAIVVPVVMSDDRHADHQAEGEQRIHQRLAPFGLLLAEMPVDVQRLRIERHVGEQHVVHLGDGAVVAVLEHLAGDEIVEIDAAALVPLRRDLSDMIVSCCAGSAGRALTFRLP